MDLPDCPPGAEGYEDTVVEMAKKPSQEDGDCTKAEQEFNDHLNSLKIKVDNVGTRCMVERRGRDVSGKWIYLCYPCAAVCSGESILQTHISGKKHKTKLALRNVWPQSIFDEHPYILSEKGILKDKSKDAGGATEKVLQKMAEEVNLHNSSNLSDSDKKYNAYRAVKCHLQDSLDNIKTPLLGLEYLVEHPPEQAHYEPSYICTLCSKQGHPRTIINHLTCFWHRYNYLSRHYSKAMAMLAPYKGAHQYREGVNVIINRLTQRVEDKYGRLKPVNIDKEEYDKDRDVIHQWIFRGYHFSEKEGPTFEEVVDIGLIESIQKSSVDGKNFDRDKRDPSPPKVAAPTKPLFNNYTRPAGRQERRVSNDALSDISDEPDPRRRDLVNRPQRPPQRFEPYRGRPETAPDHRYTHKTKAADKDKNAKPPNYEYKVILAKEQSKQAEDSLNKTLAYHEKNPEKHPLYPEEWKKFWNRRYKEIQSEGKDPSKHDFKPEWIKYWTGRMKELHEQEVKVQVDEIYRRMCLPPPGEEDKTAADAGRKSAERRRSPDKRRSSERRRSPDNRRRSPLPRRRSPDPRRRSPDPRRRSPDPRRRSPDPRRRSPLPLPRRRTPDRRRSPPSNDRFKVRKDDDRNRRDYRSPGHRFGDTRPDPSRLQDRLRSRSPVHSRTRSPPRTHFEIESVRRSRSPLSRRADPAPLRNRSPARPASHATHSADVAPSLQTVLISDDELKPDDGLSPWNSDNESIGSIPSRRSEISRASRARRDGPRARPADPADLGPPENIVATLRLLVALEDYLGSLGPKIVDLLTEALKMEKEKANSSEDLLVRDSAVVLMETAKEKLKGAVQAGLVGAAAAPAIRAAVVRVAATLHECDTRMQKAKEVAAAPGVKRKRTRPKIRPRRRKAMMAAAAAQKASTSKPSSAGVSVAGVGEVDRAQIAQQMAAALIAQGKTDVSSAELAQLVDAVVGMAQAKKREAEIKKKVEARAMTRDLEPAPPARGKTASALQLLQSAYDENEKRVEKDDAPDAPDAMDGLSDSDLETLLKNFNELSAEEQHSLIAYLKKLEAREPQRVEKLRQYVSAAGDSAPAPAAPASAPGGRVDPAPATVMIESDDDDYAVEEVFQSATQKVKEDQMRQEMEIVKKSLEESKAVTPTVEAKSVSAAAHTSSASDLFALVQASLQTVASSAAAVVSAAAQPRSFGDAPPPPPEPRASAPTAPLPQTPGFFSQHNLQPWADNPPVDNPPPAQGAFDDTRPPFNRDQGSFNQTNSGASFGQGGRPPLMPDSRPPVDGRAPMTQDNRGGMNQSRSPMNQDNRGPMNQDNRGSMNQDNRGPMNQENRGPMNQDNRGPFNQGELMNQNNRGPFNQGGNMNQDNRGPFNQGSNINQDNRGPFNQGGLMNQDTRGPFNQGGPMHQDNRGQFNQGPPPLQDNMGSGIQNNRGFPMQNNRGPQTQDNRSGPGYNNYGQDNMNQYNRGNNFMNGQQQQHGGFDQQKNFRGRGRGGGRGRGRGGHFY